MYFHTIVFQSFYLSPKSGSIAMKSVVCRFFCRQKISKSRLGMNDQLLLDSVDRRDRGSFWFFIVVIIFIGINRCSSEHSYRIPKLSMLFAAKCHKDASVFLESWYFDERKLSIFVFHISCVPISLPKEPGSIFSRSFKE